jgi:hypothetical protein
MSVKLDRIEAALKKEGFAVPELKLPEPEPVKKSAPVKRSPTVRIVAPGDSVVRDELKNPYWIEQENHVGDGPKKKLPRYFRVTRLGEFSTNERLFTLERFLGYYRNSPNFRTTFFRSIYYVCSNFDKTGAGHILDDFFTN